MSPPFCATVRTGLRRRHRNRALQKQHMQHIQKMADGGKLIVAGPFAAGDGNMRGMLIFDGSSLEEVRELVSADPAVKAGRFIAEVKVWKPRKG